MALGAGNLSLDHPLYRLQPLAHGRRRLGEEGGMVGFGRRHGPGVFLRPSKKSLRFAPRRVCGPRATVTTVARDDFLRQPDKKMTREGGS
jgi:hypothetical protein